MNIVWRAGLAVRRKWARSLTLFLIMGLIFAALIAGAVVKKSIGGMREALNKNFHAGFTVSAGSGLLKERDAQKILKTEGIKKANFQANELVETGSLKLVEGGGGVTLDKTDESKNLVASFVNESTEIEEFLNGKYEMREGRGILNESDNEVLIHEEFAKLNQIKVGDEIEVGLLKKKMKLKVVGIFSGKDSKQTFASEMIENRFFVSMKTLAKIKSKMEYTTAKYLVKDPKQVDVVMGTVKKLDIDFGKLNIENNFAKKAGIYQTAENVEKILMKMLLGVSVIGILILGFVLLFWFRGRVHEIGTLLAIGKTKLDIFLQILAELLIIASLCFIPAIMVGNLSAGALTERIMSDANPDQTGNTTDMVLTRKSLDLPDYVEVYLSGMSVILLSISGASVSVMRLKPKEILTKMK